MAKNSVQFARIASPEEIAEYLTSLAVGLKRGEISLESGERSLHLSPAGDVKLELKVGQKARKGRIELEIGWKRSTAAKTSELRVAVGQQRPPGAYPFSAPPATRSRIRERSVTSVLREDLGQDLAMMARLVQSQLIRG